MISYYAYNMPLFQLRVLNEGEKTACEIMWRYPNAEQARVLSLITMLCNDVAILGRSDVRNSTYIRIINICHALQYSDEDQNMSTSWLGVAPRYHHFFFISSKEKKTATSLLEIPLEGSSTVKQRQVFIRT